MTINEETAFIEGTEMALDWNLPIPEKDIIEYYKLIEKRKNLTKND